MSEKFCIFCGETPKDKNLEHVIPQWLIKMTGREKKDVYSLYPEHDKHIPFMRFTFPACTECNTKYAKMEAAVKPVLENVLSGKTISGADASLLMDWFDKIRIGMWLTSMYFDSKLKNDVRPHFFIDSRVAKTDRMLSIRKIVETDDEKGIYIGGTETPLFSYCPSTFTMRINNYYFVNASLDNIVSQRVGFPSISNAEVVDMENGAFACEVRKGRNKITNPIISSYIPNKDSITFYQPIYKDFIGFKDFPKDDYLIQHSYDVANGLGGVFVQKGNVGNTRYLSPTDKVSTKLKVGQMPNMVKEVCEIQNKINSISKTQSPETFYGSQINSLLLDSMKRQK